MYNAYKVLTKILQPLLALLFFSILKPIRIWSNLLKNIIHIVD